MKWTAKRHYDGLEVGFWKNLHRVRVAWIVDRIGRERHLHTGAFRILDVGCGDAVIAKRLRDAFPDVEIHGIDLDDVRLARARAYCADVRLHRSDVAALPFRAGAFNLVLCHHVVEHVADDMQVLRECHRVLAPTGLFIVGIPHEGGITGRILRRIHRKLYAEGEHVNFYTIDSMRGRLAEAGFNGVEYAKFGFLFPHYYLHVLLVWNRITFTIGHLISQRFDATADSLIFGARKAGSAARPIS